MKSIKPGRGPSAMAAVGGVVAVIFGIFWIGMASKMTGGGGDGFPSAGGPSPGGGAASFLPLFGVLFVVVAICGVIYNLKNATSKDRFSSFDITDQSEESDPLNEVFGREKEAPKVSSKAERTVRERLAKLEGLYQEGLVTEEEYQEQRKAIISSV